MRVARDSPLAADVRALLDEHLAEMRRVSPPESVHALAAEALADPRVLFLTARSADGSVLGCGALAPLPGGEREVKAMRTALDARGRGVASAVLAALIDAARVAAVPRLRLETGTEVFFDPAVRLYLRYGFAPCGPFGDYADDPHSRYLELALDAPGPRGQPAGAPGVRRSF